MSQQGYIGRNPGDGRTIVNRQTTHVTTGVQTSFTMTVGYEVGYLDVYLNGIKQTETLDYTASDGSTINFGLSFPPVNGDVLEFVAFETLNISNIKSARRNFSVGQDLDVSGNVTIGSSLTVASDLVVNGTFTTINTEILDVEDKTVGIASTSSPSNTTADGAGIVIYGGSDGDKSITWNTEKSNFVIVGGGVSIGTGVTISTPAANVLAFSVNSAEKARFNNFGAFTVGYEGEAWHESTYVGVLQAGSGAWIGQTPGASARAEWTNNAYYDSVNTRWEYIAADEANRIVLENGELKVQSADAGSADGAITWNEKLKMTVGGDFKIGAPTGIGITISSSGNVDSIGIITATTFSGGFSGDLLIEDKIVHTGDTNTAIRFPAADTITAETAGSERLRIDSNGNVGVNTDFSGSQTWRNGRRLEIFGGEGNVTGEIHLGAIRSDANQSVGSVNFFDNGQDTNHKQIALIEADKAGSTSNKRGGDLIFFTKNDNVASPTEKLRITSAGDVGIGVADPDAKLEVLEDIYVKGSSGDGGVGIQIRSGSSALSNQHQIRTGGGSGDQLFIEALGGSSAIVTKVAGSERMRITSAGLMGIGINSPARILHLHESSSDTCQLHITNSTTGTTGSDGVSFALGSDESLIINQRESNSILLKTADSERVRIDSVGRLFIGTTTTTLGSGGVFGEINLRGGTEGAGIHLADNDANVHGGLFTSDNSNAMFIRTITNHPMIFRTNNTQRMQITSTGNLLIGTTTSEDTTGNSGPKIIHTGDIQIDGDQKVLLFRSTSSTAQKQSGIQWWNENGAGVQCAIFGIRETVTYAATALSFYTTENVDTSANNSEGDITERMRIVSQGRLRIKCEDFTNDPSSSNRGVMIGDSSTGTSFSNGSSTGGANNILFINGNGLVGKISTSGSSTTYHTSSDYRLKENAVAISDGITRLKTLKPYRFNFKADAGTTLDGFFAHEVSPAVPEAVDGEKDELYTEDWSEYKVGDPKMQSIDHSKLVPLLTAALQEAVAKIETLETKVAALEGS